MAGGKSRRMGRDKAWLDLGDGRPIVRRVADVLSSVADEVIVVANDDRYLALGLRVVGDRYPGIGPLGGIATALSAASNEAVIVVACDMPFLSEDVLRLLVERAADADVVLPRIGGEDEPLHALYSKRCLPAIERAVAEGRLRANAFLPDVRVRVIAEDDLRVVDPEMRSFINVNTPEELSRATSGFAARSESTRLRPSARRRGEQPRRRAD